MSIAPANSASIAAGPALKLVHCTLTCGPIALSNQPLALPTMAWACVMLGNAPTRMVFAPPCPQAETEAARANIAIKNRLLMLLASDRDGHDATGFFLLPLAPLAVLGYLRPLVDDQIRESRVVEDAGCSVAHIEKNLVQGAMRQVAVNQFAQLLGVAEWRQRTVDQTDDLAQVNVNRFAAQLIATLGSAHAFDQARVLHFEQDQFQKLFWQRLFIGDVANLDCSLMMMPGKHHESLETVKPLL